MAQYLLRRTIILVVSLLVAMVVIFLLLRALPGDPANALLSINATPSRSPRHAHRSGLICPSTSSS